MISISRSNRIVKSTVELTPSKSINNRALIIRALCNENFEIENQSHSTDSEILYNVLEKLPSQIDVNDAGTAFRFLTAYLSIQEGEFILTGSDRMKKRPIGKLVDALRSLGAQIDFMENDNFPPLKISGEQLKGGSLEIDASESSQFISALLMIAPKFQDGLVLALTGKINSEPYIRMTLDVMKNFGVEPKLSANTISIPCCKYIPRNYKIENDWSSASFWFEVAALSDESEIKLIGLDKNSIQGDSIAVEIFSMLGVESEFSGSDLIIRKYKDSRTNSLFEFDFSSCPDLVMAVAATCSTLKIPSVFNGVGNLRIKESDRLLSLKTELEKTGAEIVVTEDSFSLNPTDRIGRHLSLNAHNDHRMVMSLAPIALRYENILIDDHLPVNKSYPEFWEQLKLADFKCEVS